MARPVIVLLLLLGVAALAHAAMPVIRNLKVDQVTGNSAVVSWGVDRSRVVLDVGLGLQVTYGKPGQETCKLIYTGENSQTLSGRKHTIISPIYFTISLNFLSIN